MAFHDTAFNSVLECDVDVRQGLCVPHGMIRVPAEARKTSEPMVQSPSSRRGSARSRGGVGPVPCPPQCLQMMQLPRACCLSSFTSVICSGLVSLEQASEKKPALISTEIAALGCEVSQLISVKSELPPHCSKACGGDSVALSIKAKVLTREPLKDILMLSPSAPPLPPSECQPSPLQGFCTCCLL